MSRHTRLLSMVISLFLGDPVFSSPPPSLSQKPAHHTETGFRNPYLPVQKKSAFKFLYMRAFGDEKWADYQKDAHLVPIVQPEKNKIAHPAFDSLTVTWIGHSTVLLQIAEQNILTDPIFSERASPVSWAGPKRVTKTALSLGELPPIHHVIISHNHYDHLDAYTVKKLGNQPLWHVPLKLKEFFLEQGIDPSRIIEYDWYDTKKWDYPSSRGQQNFRVTATPSQHWSKRSLFDTMKTLWASWVIEINGKKIWFGGDTGYNSVQFKEIGEKFGSIDFAMIPIGAYEPRWFMKGSHVNPEEAVMIHNDIHSLESMGIHWGCFPLTAEPIMDPTQKLKEAKSKVGLKQGKFEYWKIGQVRSY